MNRTGFLVLSILNVNHANSSLSSMSTKEITGAENFFCKDNTVFKQIVQLEKAGYICKGIKDGKSNTYYITDLGCEFLKEIKGLKN